MATFSVLRNRDCTEPTGPERRHPREGKEGGRREKGKGGEGEGQEGGQGEEGLTAVSRRRNIILHRMGLCRGSVITCEQRRTVEAAMPGERSS